MATYTSYLNLEKPTTSETFNLLKMNQNWDKIDNGVSALNSKIQNVTTFDNLGSFSTLQELATLLDTKQSNMAGHTQAAIEVTASASVGVFAAGLYQGFLYKPASNNYARTMLFSAVSSKTTTGVKDAGNWIFGEVNITTN